MQALDSALAFGLTMLVLAMVVTTIVETLHRIFGLREEGLALLLGNFYDRILASRTAGAGAGADLRQSFIEMMTVNRGPVGKAPLTALHRALHVDARSEDRKFLNWIWSGRRLGSLDLNAFMERLGGSEYGVRLVTQAGVAGEKGIEWMLKDVSQKFDAFGHEASEYFESRARLLSVLVGFVLAFAINVNAITLFGTFMKRPDVTQAVIARGQEVTDRYEALQTQAALNASAAGAPTPEARESIQQAADQASASVKELQAVGVPIFWTAQSVADFRSARITSILGILLGGMLIGLGAPFWYKAVQALTGVRSTAQKETSTRETSASATPPPPSGPNQMPQTPIDAFHAALGAMLAAGEVRPPEEAVG